MNFNYSTDNTHDNEYKLFGDTTAEVIHLYGIKIKYLITEKIQQDKIFGEHHSIKIDNEKVHELFAMPQANDMWEGDSDLYSKFGLQNLDTVSLFIARVDMEELHPELVNRDGRATVDNLPHGNLVVFDSNKIMEITDMKLSSSDFGNNNIFDSNLTKNVYKITLKTYIANRDDYTKAEDISNSDEVEYEDFGNLEAIFGAEDEHYEDVTKRAEERIIEDEQILPNEVRKKAVRQKTEETNPFGEFG